MSNDERLSMWIPHKKYNFKGSAHHIKLKEPQRQRTVGGYSVWGKRAGAGVAALSSGRRRIPERLTVPVLTEPPRPPDAAQVSPHLNPYPHKYS